MIRRYKAHIVLEYLHCDVCDTEMRPLAPGWYMCPNCGHNERDTTEYPKQSIVRGEQIEPTSISNS